MRILGLQDLSQDSEELGLGDWLRISSQKRRFRQRCPGQKRVWNLTGVPGPHLQSRAVTMALLWPEDWQSKDGTLHSSSRCPITAKLEFHQWASEPRGPQSPCPTPSSSRNPYPC